MLKNFSSLAAPDIVIMTTSGAASYKMVIIMTISIAMSDEKVINMITFPPQWTENIF